MWITLRSWNFMLTKIILEKWDQITNCDECYKKELRTFKFFSETIHFPNILQKTHKFCENFLVFKFLINVWRIWQSFIFYLKKIIWLTLIFTTFSCTSHTQTLKKTISKKSVANFFQEIQPGFTSALIHTWKITNSRAHQFHRMPWKKEKRGKILTTSKLCRINCERVMGFYLPKILASVKREREKERNKDFCVVFLVVEVKVRGTESRPRQWPVFVKSSLPR